MNNDALTTAQPSFPVKETMILLIFCCLALFYGINTSKVSLNYFIAFKDERVNSKLSKEFSTTLKEYNIVSISDYQKLGTSRKYVYEVNYVKGDKLLTTQVKRTLLTSDSSVWIDVSDGQVSFASDSMDGEEFDEIESQYSLAQEVIAATIDSISEHENNIEKWKLE